MPIVARSLVSADYRNGMSGPRGGRVQRQTCFPGQVREHLSCQAEKLKLFPGTREPLGWILVRLLATFQMSGPA